MAFSRVTSFAAETYLARNDLDSEFNNIANYLNSSVLTSPLSQDLDFGYTYTIQNLREFWTIRNAAEFGGFTSTAIQAAIDDAVSAGEEGFIFLPPGTWSLTRTVSLASGIYLLGTPGTILQRTSGTFVDTNEGIILLEGSIEGCGILDVTIDGNSISNTSNGGLHGIAVRQATDVVIRRVRIKNIGAAADGTGSNNDGISVGSSSTASERVWIEDCYISDPIENGIEVINAEHVWIRQNRIYQNGTAMDNGILGYTSQKFRNIYIVDNEIEASTEADGIRIGLNTGSAYSASFENVHVVGNTIKSCAQYGIFADRLRGLHIRGNTIRDSGEDGIRVTTSTEVEIHDNWLYTIATSSAAGTRYPSIHILGTSALAAESISIQGNQCYEQHSDGVLVYAGSGVTINDVIVSNNKTRNTGRVYTGASCAAISIVADSGTLQGVTLNGNHCYRNDSPATDHDGIYLDGSDITMNGNNVKDVAFNSGVPIDRTNAVNLEEGHNLET